MSAAEGEFARRDRSTGSERVRASRDGDRFHYTWAATRLLLLLSPTSELQQVSIEGLGSPPSDEEPDGAEVIDLVEYYGHPEESFTALEVRQFKHSTLNPHRNLTMGEITKILQKFGQLDDALRAQHPQADIRFSIVTNKPIAPAAVGAVGAVAEGQQPVAGSSVASLMDGIGLGPEGAASLCSRLELRGREPSLTTLRRGLDRGISGLTADTDVRVSASLFDLVASRASTDSDGPIRSADVLAAFGCREDDLAPAPNLLDTAPFMVRDSYRDLADQVLKAPGAVIVTAEGGVGKSTFARALPELLHDRADVIIFDCFGRGSYRSPDRPRHRPRDGLVQIATEVAGLGLGLPIVPTGNLAPEEYTKAFVRRLSSASEVLADSGERELVIVVDAADNAVMAAADNADPRPFVRDLLRLKNGLPANVHIVLTCRPERQRLLEAPADTTILRLQAFDGAETAKIVRATHPSAADQDVVEIHDRTLGNPRVISTVLSESELIQESLSRLTGLTSRTSPLDALMEDQVAQALDSAGGLRAELERTAQLLTLLRPSVPLDVLAELAGTQVSGVRSFISDLGRGLIESNGSVQFLDEPTETYFRTHHRATPRVAAEVAANLRELSSSSAYAAASLPEVLWSANLYDELLALVATDEALPSSNDVERTQVEHLRVEFGLRAAVRLRRPDSIVQLAMRAGAGRAGKGRQFTVIRDNPDLAGSSMEARILRELIASREIPQTWPGSTLGAEAAMLAHSGEGASAARNRARQASLAIEAWARSPRKQHSREDEITPLQVAHIALVLFRTDGPESAARYLSRWRPARFALESGAALAHVLVSRADDEAVSSLIASSTHPAILLGIFGEMQRVGMGADVSIVAGAWATLNRFDKHLVSDEYEHRDAEDIALRGASWLCALAVCHSVASATVAAQRLHTCFPNSPPRGLGDRFGRGRPGLLFAIALHTELMGETLDLRHFRPVNVGGKRGKPDPGRSDEEDLNRYLGPSLGWLTSWAKYALGGLDSQSALEMIKRYPKPHLRDDTWSITLRLARQILPLIGSGFQEKWVVDELDQVIRSIAVETPIPGAREVIPGLRGDVRFGSAALELANAARIALAETPDTSDSKAETLVGIARSLCAFSQAEAGSYFVQAVQAATGVGDDAPYRWDAVVALTRASAGIDRSDAIALATRVANLAAIVEPILHHGISERHLVSALALLSGPDVFRILGQWRDRRFGDLDSQLRGLVDGNRALLATRPDLSVVLAPFSTGFDLDDALRRFEGDDGIDANVLSTVNNLAARLGRTLEARFEQSPLPDPPKSVASEAFRSSASALSLTERTRRSATVERCRAEISALDLTESVEFDTAVQRQRDTPTYGDNILAAEVFRRSELQWGPILDAALGSENLSRYDLAKLLNEALARPRTAQSFVESLKNAVSVYVERHGAQLLHGNWMSLDLPEAAALLDLSTTDLLKRALDHLNFEEALNDADHCFMLAAGASVLLDPSTAARVLGGAVSSLEADLGVEPLSVSGRAREEPIDVAIANFLWAALGDTSAAIRWQASHAVRTAIELDASDLIVALGAAVVRGDAAGYADERFPFYEMSAAEWLLIAVERVARDNPAAIGALMSGVAALSSRYPDHAAIQRGCYSIARDIASSGHTSVGTDWEAQLAAPVVLESWRRPRQPSPMSKGAPRAEFRIDFDFDEYVLGRLTETFIITHQEVLNAVSTLVLDEWGWESDGDRVEDPRRTADVYREGETYSYKWEIPKVEDLEYYLERHAALTIAGRLMRTAIPYRDPDAHRPDVLGWVAGFDIARPDGRWITDQRRSVPGSLAIIGNRGNIEVDETQFLAALEPAEGWVTVWQSASVAEYERSLNVDIASALVNPDATTALLRALQTDEAHWGFRIPSADPEDAEFQFNSPPFQLQGWVSTPYSEGGIDRLDLLADSLTPSLPRPSEEIVDALGISSAEGGVRWRRSVDGNVVLASETWAEISVAREQRGPSGNRLRIATAALDELLNHLGLALIVEVRIRHEDRRFHEDYILDNEGGDRDRGNEFRIFFYRPGAGWSDSSGRIGTG